MTEAYAMGRGHAEGPEVSGCRACAVCERVAGVEPGVRRGMSVRLIMECLRERNVHGEHRVRVACADAHAERVSHKTGGSGNGNGKGGRGLTLRDGHVECEVNEIVGLKHGLQRKGSLFGWRLGGWPQNTMEGTHEEKAEGAQSAAGGEVSGDVSSVQTRHAASLVAHVVRSPAKGVE